MARQIERVVPITAAQRDLWLVDRTSPEGSLSYCLTLNVDIRGPLDRDVAERAVQVLYERRDALRVTFSADGAEMRVHAPGRVHFEHVDLTHASEAERERALRERVQRSVERAFDLVNGPLFRAELIALEPRRHTLLLRTHHIVCDGWSLGVLLDEFATLYALHRDRAPDLPSAPAYADFAAAEAGAAATGQSANAAFWSEALTPLPPPLELPAVKPRPPVRSFASARMDHVFDRDVIDRIAARARDHGQTLFSAIFAAVNLVLSRICATPDVVIGVPTAAQLRSAPRDLVGYCVSFVPVRSRVDSAGSFLALVQSTREGFRDAMKHRIAFAELIGLLGLRSDPSRLPLLNAVLTSLPLSTRHIDGSEPLSLQAEHVARPYENFEILANVFLADGDARVECQYNTALYDHASVRGWFAAVEAVLATAADDFLVPVDAIDLLPHAERVQLERWNHAVAPAAASSIPALLEASARRFADRTAVSFGAESLTYAELDARANRLAHALREYAAARGAVVGLLLDRGVETVVAQLAVLKAGAAFVPLDPAYPRERIAYMLAQCKVSLVVLHGDTRALMMLLGGQAVRVLDLRLHADAIAAQASDAPGGDSESAASPDDIAYIVYTSGSTGKPKGVRVPHRTVVGFLEAITRELGLSGSDRVLATTSPSFDPSILETFGTLMLGAHVIVASREQIQDPYALRALVESSGATVMQTTPSAWRMLIEAGWRGAPAFKAISGSEALSVDLACGLLERAGEVWNLYGPTETTVWATAWRVHAPEAGISIGKPLANTRIWVLDERRRMCPLGVPGEIYIGGRGVALGYVESPELTAEKFLESPFNPGERMYRTGDRGRWRPDGTLEFLGRRDFQLKVRGYRIEPGEVEAALAAHPQVGSTVVTAREVEPGDTRLVAYIVCRQTAPAAVELREHLRRELPEYMIPQLFVALDAMPRLPNGKIDRNGLPAPTLADAHARRGHVAPRTAEEIAIAGIWQQLLGVPRVDVTDNFFDLGGHSLLAMSVVARIEEALDVRLSPRQLVYESLEQVARAATRTREEPPAKARTGGRWFARWFGRRS